MVTDMYTRRYWIFCFALFVYAQIAIAGNDDNLVVLRAGAMERIGKTESVADRGAIRLYAAKGETEPFQIIVAARGSGLQGVAVVAGDLIGKSGIISAGNVKLFKVQYIDVPKNSPRAPLPPGLYPDVLIPFENPYNVDAAASSTGAVPFDVGDGENQPIWIDVKVPLDAVAGKYNGSLTVSDNAGRPVKISYSLRVWEFSLPKIPSLQSFFGTWEIEKFYKLKWGSDRWFKLWRRYTDILIDHRLASEYPQDLEIDAAQDGSLVFEKNFGGYASSREIFDYYMVERGMSALCIPIDGKYPFKNPLGANRERAKAFVRNFQEFAKSNGWGNRTYVYVIDEPESAKSYNDVRTWGAFCNDVGNDILHLVTVPPRPHKAAWGSLVGSVDIWAAMAGTITKQEAEERLAEGDVLWTYQALVQDKVSPKWLIDYYPIEYRILIWLARTYGMIGVEYWETTWWWGTPNPWQQIAVYKCMGNNMGEGQLLYPGTIDTVGFDGPVASMRLKWVREGFEDYEYFVMLDALGDQAFVAKTVEKTAKSWSEWTKNTELLMKKRKRLGKRLEKLMRKRNGN